MKKTNAVSKETVQRGIVKWISIAVAPFAVLLIILNVVSYQMSVELVENTIDSMLQMWMHDVNGQMESMENSVQRLLNDNTYSLLVLKKPLDETEIYFSRQKIYSQMQQNTLVSSAEEALFLFAPDSGQMLIQYPEGELEEKDSLKEFLQECFGERTSETMSSWQVQKIGREYYMLYLQGAYGLWIGSCSKVSAVMSGMLGDSSDHTEMSRLILKLGDACYQVDQESTTMLGEKEGITDNRFVAEDPARGMQLAFQPKRAHFFLYGSPHMWVLLFLSVILLSLLPMLLKNISRKITSPVQDLGAAMKSLQEGNFEVHLQADYQFREMEEIKGIFNEMVCRIEKLKSDVYEEKLSRQKTQSDFLQMQIKPHFYLNCLNQIHILAKMGDLKSVSNVSQYLISYFRYLLKTNRDLVPLKEELEFIDNFLYIQKLRYPAGFSYCCNRGPDTEDLFLPPLCLFTFVENSLKYGLGPYGELKLSIDIRRGEQGYFLSVEDSGQGFPEQVLRALQQGQEIKASENRTCIGISNARQRLIYAFGERASIDFSNNAVLGGARVSITIFERGGKTDERK